VQKEVFDGISPAAVKPKKLVVQNATDLWESSATVVVTYFLRLESECGADHPKFCTSITTVYNTSIAKQV
jgi:hypothetical protein